MTFSKKDKFLQRSYESLNNYPDETLVVIINISETMATRHDNNEYIDEFHNPRYYTTYEIPGYIYDRISPLLNRIFVRNFDLIPGLCAEVEVRNLSQIEEQDFVESMELSTAAHLNIDEAIVNIGAEKITELPHNTAAKEKTLVSVIDTGVNETRTLKGKIVSYKNFTFEVNEDMCDQTKYEPFTHGHGTAIANIISYLAPEAQFLIYKAVGSYTKYGMTGEYLLPPDKGTPDKGYIRKAIDESVKKNAHVINMSLGVPPCGASDNICKLCDTANAAVHAGATVVAAAGNRENSLKKIYYRIDDPGQASDIITVGACTKINTIWDGSAEGPTSYGLWKPEVVAPGRGVRTFCSRDEPEYRTGTSISTAVVSGTVALLRRINTNPADIKEALMHTAEQLINPYGRGAVYPINVQGTGKVNVEKAYNYLVKKDDEEINKKVDR